MIKDIIIHVWGEAEREPFGHTGYLSWNRLRPATSQRYSHRASISPHSNLPGCVGRLSRFLAMSRPPF